MADQEEESPESKISPYEDLNTKQKQITGETFPNVVLEMCDGCFWCSICINERGLTKACPLCKNKTSRVTMTIDEVCSVEVDEKRGVTLHFDRKLPLR